MSWRRRRVSDEPGLRQRPRTQMVVSSAGHARPMELRASGLSSVAGGRGAGELARFDIPHGRLTEESTVLPIKLAGTFVADFEGCACGIQAVVEHALSRYMQPKLLLVLKGTHCGQRTELMVQRGYAHPRHGREFLNT
jgi:hypothetical protein